MSDASSGNGPRGQATTEPASDGELQSLYRLAGRPEELAERQVAPARDAARAAWRGQVRRGRRRRIAWTLTAAAAALIVAGVVRSRPPQRASSAAEVVAQAPAASAPAIPVATLELAFGAVDLEPPPAGGDTARGLLRAGAILTTGADAGAALALPGGASVRLDSGSRLRLVSASSVELLGGALYLDSGPHGEPGRGVSVGTPLGVVTHVGTQFEARLVVAPDDVATSAGATLRVKVREGSVRVHGARGEHAAAAGTELSVAADGTARRGTVAASAADWGWVQRTAPPPAIEGTSLASFLDWTARETGVRWRIEGRPPMRPAEVVLHGSIAGLTPEEALEVVVPGAGFTQRRVGGERVLVAVASTPPS